MNLRKGISNLFIPQEENNYRAKVLHPSFLALFVFLFLINQTLINFFALLQPGVLGYSSDITPQRIVDLTNQERSKNGLAPLKLNSLLSEAAQRKAGDMFAFDYWAHKSPSGREPWAFLKEVGYDYRVAGENLARDFSEPESVMGAWMKSPTHKENIVSPKFREIGVAVVDGALGGIQTTLVVQFFGTQAAASLVEKSPVKTEPVVAASPEEEATPVVARSPKEELSPVVLAESEPMVSPLDLTKGLSIFFFGIITGALIIDGYLVIKKRAYRSAGRTTAHAAFLAVVFLLILLKGGPGLIN